MQGEERRRSREGATDTARRKLLRAAVGALGAAAAGKLPYQPPRARSFFGTRSAWAQATGPFVATLAGRLGRGAAGGAEDTGSDLWEVELLAAPARLSIVATPGALLDVEIYLFAPGSARRVNLLTGTEAGLDLEGLAAPEAHELTLDAAGTYGVAIEDSRTADRETAGDYVITLRADRSLGEAKLVVDEGLEFDVCDPVARS